MLAICRIIINSFSFPNLAKLLTDDIPIFHPFKLVLIESLQAHAMLSSRAGSFGYWEHFLGAFLQDPAFYPGRVPVSALFGKIVVWFICTLIGVSLGVAGNGSNLGECHRQVVLIDRATKAIKRKKWC